MKSGFKGMFIVMSNPVDIITYYVYKVSGLPKNSVIGTSIDSSILKTLIGDLLSVYPRRVHAYSMGEHEDS